jgi:hypothetical protein
MNILNGATAMIESIEDDDLQAANIFLVGNVGSENPSDWRTYYFQRGSNVDIEGRRAIARLLRSQEPLNPEYREILAALFDPETCHHYAVEREIIFKFQRGRRRRSKVEEHIYTTYIDNYIRSGMNVADAITATAKRVVVGEKHLMRIWGRKRQISKR